MRKIIKLLAVLLVLCSAFSMSVYSDYSETGIYDNASLMSAQDRAEVEKYLADASAKTGVKYILVTSADRSNIEFEFDGASDIIALNVMYSGGSYYYDIIIIGAPYKKISDSEVDRILDASDVYDNLKSGNICEGVKAFSELSAKAYKGDLWQTILICAIIAVAVASVTVGCVVYKYKKKLKSPSYPLEKYASLRLDTQSDMFIGSFVTKTRIPRPSSSRSGGGRRSGGGGRRGGR